MKYRVEQISGMKPSDPTVSVSVELLVLSFYLVELTMGNRVPKIGLLRSAHACWDGQ
jgi:hypothetical protein